MAPRPSPGTGWVVAQSFLMAALVASGPLHPGDWHRPAAILLGALLFTLGGALGIAGVLHLGDNRTALPRPRPGSRLVTRGVYRHIRHPLYASVMLAGFGWALLWQSAPAAVMALLQVAFFNAKAGAEERMLRAHFPDYPDYERRVSRFLPRFPAPAPPAPPAGPGNDRGEDCPPTRPGVRLPHD